MEPRAGSQPQSAVAGGGQVPRPIHPVAHRGPGFAVVFKDPAPAAGHQLSRGQAAQNEDADVRVAIGALERIR